MCGVCNMQWLCSVERPTKSTSLELTGVSPNTTAKAGDDVFLGCAAKASNVPKYRWTHKSLLGNNRTRLLEITRGFLEFSAVNLDKSGTYECEAYTEDEDGKILQRQSASILLTVKGKPSV